MLYAEPSHVPMACGVQRVLTHEAVRVVVTKLLDGQSIGIAREVPIPPRGTKLPVPIPMSTTVRNNAGVEEAPNGSHITSTTSNVKIFIMAMALIGPSLRSDR